jgi:hypothetical protein
MDGGLQGIRNAMNQAEPDYAGLRNQNRDLLMFRYQHMVRQAHYDQQAIDQAINNYRRSKRTQLVRFVRENNQNNPNAAQLRQELDDIRDEMIQRRDAKRRQVNQLLQNVRNIIEVYRRNIVRNTRPPLTNLDYQRVGLVRGNQNNNGCPGDLFVAAYGRFNYFIPEIQQEDPRQNRVYRAAWFAGFLVPFLSLIKEPIFSRVLANQSLRGFNQIYDMTMNSINDIVRELEAMERDGHTIIYATEYISTNNPGSLDYIASHFCDALELYRQLMEQALRVRYWVLD